MSFIGSVVKSVVIGLVASYAIKVIQDKFLNSEEEVETEEEDAVEVAK